MKHIKPTTPPQTLPPDAEPWQRLLWAAADWMQVHGHCSGPYDADGRGCAIHAINSAAMERTGNFDHAKESIRSLSTWLRASGLDDCVPDWSDSSDQDTVIAAMRAAALS